LTLYTRDRWNGLQWEGTAGYEAIGTDDFGKHEFYKFYITGDTGKNIDHIKFHHSHVLRCGNRAPVKFTQYQLAGWDLPEGQHIIGELARDETTRASIASLISKSLVEVIKMPGIRGLFSGISGDLGSSNVESKNELENRIRAAVEYRNFNNLSFLDKEDEYQQFQLGGVMTGLADILEQQRRATSGAMEIPEMILYGSADKKGLIFQKDGTQSPEIEIYQQTINSKQDYILRPILDKLLPILWRIANGKTMPEGTTYEFIPIFKESQTAKLERATLVINNSKTLFEMGVFSPKDVAVEVRQYSKQTGFGTNLTDEKINSLSEDLSNKDDNISPDVDANPNNDKFGNEVKPRNQQKETEINKKNYKLERRGGKR
jgi:phage-related protein (TIGR01555 family)